MFRTKHENSLAIHSQTTMPDDKKDIPLEAIRGLAAIVVVLWHCCVGFLPQHTGVFPQYAAYSWQGNPLFCLINGAAAVSLFFVLSGYVLTRRYFLSGNNAILLKGMVKRWPRLMGPVLATVLISYIFFVAGFYAFEEAGALSGSPWLVKFAYAYDDPFPVSLWGALKQGAFLVFYRGDSTYDSSLWTMRPEFIGSLIVFGMAPIFFEAKKLSAWIIVGLATGLIILSHFAMPNIVAFPVGIAIASLLPANRTISKWTACGMLCAAFYLMGYSGKGIGAYFIFNHFPSQDKYYMYPPIVGAAIIICVVETFPPLRRIFSGAISRWLGEFSFPIYLIHVLIICSIGSVVYLHYGRIPAIISVLVATPVAAFPLLIFNRRWVRFVNHTVEKLLQTPKNEKTKH